MEKCSCFNSLISLERFKTVALRSSSVLILREGDLLTLLSSFSAGEVVSILLQCLPISALPTSLDIALLSSPMVLLGPCSLISDIF